MCVSLVPLTAVADSWMDEYFSVYWVTDDLAEVQSKDDGLYGLVNVDGEVVLPVEYDLLYAFQLREEPYLAEVLKDGLWGLINISGEIVLPAKYDERIDISYFQYEPSLATVKKDGLYGLINKDLEIVLPFEYDRIIIDSALIRAEKGGLWGAVNASGEIVLPFEYDAYQLLGTASDYLFGIKKGEELWGIINVSGEIELICGICFKAKKGKNPCVCKPDVTTCKDCGKNPCVCKPDLICENCGYYSCDCASALEPNCEACGKYPCVCYGLEPNCKDCGKNPCVCKPLDPNINYTVGGKYGFGRVTNGSSDAPQMADALAILRFLVKLSSPIGTDANSRAAANITNPGAGDPKMADALALLRFLVKLSSPLDPYYRGGK